MNEFEKAKKSYEGTAVPPELEGRVQAGIRQGKRNYRMKQLRRFAGTAAACAIILVGSLNLSPAMAAAAAEVPVLGQLFQVLTIRDFEAEQDQAHYSVSVPGIQGDSALAQKVNAEIQAVVDQHLVEQREMWEEYHDVFLATGGTEEEWQAHHQMDVAVNYQVKYQKDTTLSFVVELSQSSTQASLEQYYYNLDLKKDKTITLADVLGENWVDLCNQAVTAHIQAAGENSLFFPPEEGGFTTVDESTAFYLQEDGVPVVVFPKYAIAAGAAGIIEIPVA